jgi:hypothetical protein
MTLHTVLWFKILATVILWAIPLLFAPPSLFRRLGFPPPQPVVFVKLLGAAFTALLVGYVRGLSVLADERHPADAVLVGLVSNALACLIIVAYGLAGAYAKWALLARAYMWVSALVTGLVSIGLLVHGRLLG